MVFHTKSFCFLALWNDDVVLLPSAQLEKELEHKDEKINKIKAVAIKAKKELDISKKEVE